jgi:CheY-like chemotaxis protein
MPTQPSASAPFEVLVVDDEIEIRELIAEYLDARGLRAAVA